MHLKLKQKKFFYKFKKEKVFLFEYFFEVNKPPDGISKEDYMKELKSEYWKLKREEARRLLGLVKK